MAYPWKNVPQAVDSKGTRYLNELSLDANLQLLEMGVARLKHQPNDPPTTSNEGK